MPPRIAIATPNRNAYSETFIAAHLERLKEVVLVLSDGSLPYMANGIPLLAPGGFRGRLQNMVGMGIRRKSGAEMVRERIEEALRKHRVDVLLAEYGPTGEALVDSARAAGVPLVVHFHGYDAHKHEVVERMRGYKQLFSNSTVLVVVSRAMEHQLLALGAPREKLHRIVYGVDVVRFTPGNPADAPPTFIAVGRFTDKKAPQLTLLAFRKAWQQRPGARLVMVGTGELLESVRQLVLAWGMEAAVELPGVLKPGEVAMRMQGARAFVQHSVTTAANDMEGTPLAVLEAMACALPVIATQHAGIPDVVAHGVSGLLCPERDVEAMARNMMQVMDQPLMAAAMGQAGRAHVLAHHRVEDTVAALQGLLEQVAQGSRG